MTPATTSVVTYYKGAGAGESSKARKLQVPFVIGYQGKAGMLGMRPLFVAVEGRAELIRDKARFADHWTKDLDRWFEQGVDTPGLVMIEVEAKRIHYWDGEDEGEVRLAATANV